MGGTLYKKRHDPRIGRRRAVRPKTFRTEASAKAYAEKNKLKNYKITHEKKKYKLTT